MAVRIDCDLIITTRWSVEDWEDGVALVELEFARGIRRTCKKITASDDNTAYGGSSARVNDCSNCVGIDKRATNMEG